MNRNRKDKFAVEDEVCAIQVLWKNANAAQRLADAKTKEAMSRTEQLAGEIRVGGTSTGNRLADWVVSSHCTVNDKFVLDLIGLERQFPEHVGEFILFITAEEYDTRHVCLGTDNGGGLSDLDIREEIYLGILTGESFIVNIPEGTCNFPVDWYAQWNRGQSQLCQGRLGFTKIGRLNLGNLDQPLKCRNKVNEYREGTFLGQEHVGLTRYMELEIKIGDTAIVDWFLQQNPNYDLVYNQLSHILERTKTVPKRAAVVAD